MRRFLLLLIPALLLTVAACGKAKEDEALQKARDTELSNITEGVYQPPKPAPIPDDIVVEVPESVKAKYKSVTVLVGDRKTKEVKKLKVKIGGSAQVPDTDYRIQVLAYLPDWSVRGKLVTSKSAEPKDPAIRALIFEKDKKVFDGFIFEKHQTPSFMTDTWVFGLSSEP